MQNKLTWILMTLLIIMTGSTIWLIITSGQIPSPISQSKKPDALITDVNATQFNEFGKPQHILKSPRLLHYLKNNTTLITKPFYIFENGKEAPWHIKADQGKVLHDTKTIILTGHVLIKQLPGINSRHITLLTDKMMFYPQMSLAKTDRPVTIKRPGMIVKGVGLQADLKTGEIKLLSQTHGEYKKEIEN